MSAEDGTYHALLARHDAMRLRRNLLSPGGGTEPGDTARPAPQEPYDGAADQRLIMSRLDLVAPFDELITQLYAALFTRHPALRSLFPSGMEFQQAHLARAFWYLIEHLDQPERITETFTQLGRDHRKLGVRPAQYTAFEQALCEALRFRSGEHWSAELEDAWVRMLRLGVTAMVRGAEAALREPACWSATVTEHRRCGPDLAVLRARPHEPFRYRAGQYTAVEHALLPHTWRPYYVAGEPGRDGELEFHVRCTAPGGVSEALVHRTGAGDRVRLGPPKGSLALGDGPEGEVRLVAWDTGWAAMKALLREAERRARPAAERRVRLFLGADTPAGLYDTGYAAELERRRPWLSVVTVAGGAPGEDAYGRLARAVAHGAGPASGRTLVAGPPAMVRAVTGLLLDAGLPAGNVLHDPLPDGPYPGPYTAGGHGPGVAAPPRDRPVPA
ncbi:globin domain-containing protein [Streptomyces tagetis]|uniref:nitric oxide dioxygenase n=1 Tax=Streptomyces tagetis TaxID=2820809 RepID=A0A940XLB5_9ACTN|nr:globin domain-containing protein [Streptomyces sp. RG38]MBQ0830520.1 flavohemoprotein [Streptomyces sp. RG38]